MKWYKHDPDAFLVGVIGLTLEERGLYITVIDVLYSRDGKTPNDDLFFARHCGCDPRTWRRVRDSLIAKGKLYRQADGSLMATRVLVEVEDGLKRIERMREVRQIQLQNQRSRLAYTPGQPQPQRKKEEDGRKGPGWAPSGYSNGRCLGNGKAGSIEDTLK